MFAHLLVPLDGSELSARAADAAIALAKLLGSRITGFVALPPPPLPTMSFNASVYARDLEAHDARTEARTRTVLDGFAGRAAGAGVRFEGKSVQAASVDDAIARAAEEYGCDLIVMVTHGRGAFGELLFGSHTKSVMSRTSKAVLVLH
jgi:nucleotide-binding universal stress UspA family protein